MMIKILRRISVFMPCFLANLISSSWSSVPSRSSSSSSSTAAAIFAFFFALVSSVDLLASISFCLSTRGLPAHAAPTSHHLPLVSAFRRSSSVTRIGSWARTEHGHQLWTYLQREVTHYASFSSIRPRTSSSFAWPLPRFLLQESHASCCS
jgi:hypothetical protein